MSLAEAMLEIAADMEKDAEDISLSHADAGIVLCGYVKQIRVAVKASGGSNGTVTRPYSDLSAHAQHVLGIEEAKQQLRAEREVQTSMVRKLEKEEGSIVTISGGPDDGVMIPVPGDMPVGARTALLSGVYQLEPERKLKYIGPLTP